MLSPWTYHKHIPKDRDLNLGLRLRILKACEKSIDNQDAMLRLCKNDILSYINLFVWQANFLDDESGTVGPFITWPFQDQAILDTIETCLAHKRADRDDVLWEKSREMGATWMALIISDWLCLFHDWKKVLCISHTEAAVYKSADPGCLFWKIEFMHRHLPSWMVRDAVPRKLNFEYPATNSSITGAANTERSGVGDRAQLILLDEFSKHQKASDILGQTADTGPRLIIGTHYGTGSEFHRLSQRTDMKKVIMHWSQHPEKFKGLYKYLKTPNKIDIIDKTYPYPPEFEFQHTEFPLGGPYPGLRSPWYDKECRRRNNPRDVAMHLDIDAGGSVAQVFDPFIIRQRIEEHGRPAIWEGDITHDRDTGEEAKLLTMPGGSIRLWINKKLEAFPEANYGAGADVSTGQGASNSVLSIGNADTGEKICEFATCKLDPISFATACYALLKMFQNEYGDPPRLVWEIPGPGLTYGARMKELAYPSIYYRPSTDNYGHGLASVPGWASGNKTKQALFDEYREALEFRRVINRSTIALEECLEYRYNKDSGLPEHPSDKKAPDPTGARSNHGDRAMADALMWMIMKSLGCATPRKRKEEEQKIHENSMAHRWQLTEKRQKEWV